MEQLNKLEYVGKAEKVIADLVKNKSRLTTTKIRNMLTLINELYNMARKVSGKKLNEDIQSHIQYIKMRLAYEAGRDKECKDFINKSKIMEYLGSVKDDKDKLIIVCHYMEALVAYHKFYGIGEK